MRDVVGGRAPIVGSRLDPKARRGLVSPIEARVRLGLLYGDPIEEERLALSMRSWKSDVGTLLRTCAAAVMGGRVDAAPARRLRVVSATVDNVTPEEAIEMIFAPGRGDRGRVVAFAHPHALNLARFDRRLRADLEAADVVLPDGVGLRIAARILGSSLVANVNGTDLLPHLANAAVARKAKLALVGAKPGVAARAAENLRTSHAGLDIALVSHGYLDDAGTSDLLTELRALGPVVVLVGMGSPHQERWCRMASRAVPNATFVTVGGLFDFFSGDVQRAPIAVRELGLEWAYRLAQEPRRLAKRYLLGNPLFLALVLVDRVFGRPSRLETRGTVSPASQTETSKREQGREVRAQMT